MMTQYLILHSARIILTIHTDGSEVPILQSSEGANLA